MNTEQNRIVGYNPQTGQPIYEQDPINTNNQIINQQPIQANYNNQNFEKPKKNNKKKIIIIISTIIISLVLLLIIFVYATRYTANMKSGNLRLYIPSDWESDTTGKIYTSKSGVCSVVGGISNGTVDFEGALNQLEELYGKFTVKKINGKDWKYNYTSLGSEEIYTYAIQDELGDYLVMFYKLSNEDEECNKYIERLEKSMVLK